MNDGTPLTHRAPRRIMKGNFYLHMKDYEEPGEAVQSDDLTMLAIQKK